MKKLISASFIGLCLIGNLVKAQDDEKLNIGGELYSDQRIRLKNENDWMWNENRLNLQLSKKINNTSKFNSEIWLRNIGLPNVSSLNQIYNKGIVDPFNIEIREANVLVNDFVLKNLDLKIGRQRISWGTADKFNPTDNLNPYDLEDILDFGRHRGSDAINLQYYFNSKFSLQGVFVPFFEPSNLPIGAFSSILNPDLKLSNGLKLKDYSTSLTTPKYNLAESSMVAGKFKGSVAGIDFSISYNWAHDLLPQSNYNLIIPVDTLGGVSIHSNIEYFRTHIFGADVAGSIKGVGVWAEAAAFMPENDFVIRNNLSALFPMSPVPVIVDSLLYKKSEPTIKFVLGCDYHFQEGSYLNIQYLHGFIHEKGNENLNDYFFIRYDKKFFNEKLKIAPIGGGFIVTNWDDVKNNYAIVYMPEVSYKASDDSEISILSTFFEGKGESIFAKLKDYNMLMLKFKYSF